MNEREVQFHAALLACGNVPNLRVSLDLLGTADANRYQSVQLIAKHKPKLLRHLVEADYFDVYYEHVVHGAKGEQLTEKAALWIGEFYQWLLKQQQLHSV